MGRLRDWLDDRTGYRKLVAGALTEPVPGGASWIYVFGSVLTFVLVLQMVTGVFLAMYYSPSATDAWASVAYIQDEVTLGWFVRGLHHHGASAMVIIAGLHLLQTALYGAYKKPREMNWIVGCVMLSLILAFALTGYLLPWDQTGYWATKVATGIVGTTPLIGEQMQSALQGGNEYGNLTLTRFYALHVFLLPAALIGLVAFHVYLFRRHGVTPKWGRSAEELAQKQGWFWPDQLFRDMVASVLAFGAMVGFTLWSHGASLDGPADPASNFDARPEWYFRPLFQALKYFEGSMETVVALGAPALIGAFLIGLPFLDKKPERDPRRRLVWLGALGLLFAGGGALTLVSFTEDAADPGYQRAIEDAEQDAVLARELAREHGVPVEGGTAIWTLLPDVSPTAGFARAGGPVQAAAADLWKKHCSKCHEGDRREAPLIDKGYNNRDWIRAFLQDPDGERFFGLTKVAKENMKGRMKPVRLERVDLDAIVEMVYAQTGAKDASAELVARGRALYDEGDCSDCHEIDPGVDGSAPNLLGRGSAPWFVDLIADPGAKLHYGKFNDMPAFADDLGLADRWALAEYLVWLRDH